MFRVPLLWARGWWRREAENLAAKGCRIHLRWKRSKPDSRAVIWLMCFSNWRRKPPVVSESLQVSGCPVHTLRCQHVAHREWTVPLETGRTYRPLLCSVSYRRPRHTLIGENAVPCTVGRAVSSPQDIAGSLQDREHVPSHDSRDFVGVIKCLEIGHHPG